jgi:hydrogenase maturation protein HypF
LAKEDGVFLRRISVRGVVQGVGFRPFVYRLAHRHGLKGWVLNHSGGVDIEVEGSNFALNRFLKDLKEEAPPLSRIEEVAFEDYPPKGYSGFEILESRAEEGRFLLISPDVATCEDCKREIFDPKDRRYLYPFTNCTNCGPRFTIIEDIPYDRPRTTMREFVMCPACKSEYDNPLDRRFHAQPNACPVCGPRLKIIDSRGGEIPHGEIISKAVEILKRGEILAIKGLGGFHLACDATNEKAVNLIRERKKRPSKPMAVMMPTLEEIRKHCFVSKEEEELLTSPQCPIVLLPWKKESNVSRLVAPGYNYLGVMLPYTPLHHILLRRAGLPLVMTSGNPSSLPIAKENEEAINRLSQLADYFLLHNRKIKARCDDSVMWVFDGKSMFIRRSRGYSPFPIKLPFEVNRILACGAELKNTFCLTKERYAFLSQHIGDMENLETLEHFETSIAIFKRLFRIEPEILAYDMHPDYLSTKFALEREREAQLIAVQHHHAHVASCMVENGIKEPVIGVAFDGTGYGLDGSIWGGEFLIADYRGFRRAGHFEYIPMPGGEAAIKRPYRMAISYLYTSLGKLPKLPFLSEIEEGEIDVVIRQIERGINSPLTSSCGRLFDGVSALLGVRGRTTYEAQAAIELEMSSSKGDFNARTSERTYPFHVVPVRAEETWGETSYLPPFPLIYEVRLREIFEAIVSDIWGGVSVAEIGRRFHNTVVRIIVEMCRFISSKTGLKKVALSGGCFQNRLLLRGAVNALKEEGFSPIIHSLVPCNDGGISLGQAAIANFAMNEGRRW